ncbi:MAG: AraC family transcriptional regulator [Kiloniellales bacterium]|nr:AraC family transcriptional regulator [Kiloniellales bacterium]
MLTFDQLCRGLEVDISAFAICEVRDDATFVLSEDKDSAIHYVLAGEGIAWRATGEATPLSPHCVMIVPPGSRLTISGDPERRFNFAEPQCKPLEDEWVLLQVGTANQGLTLACGYVQAQYMQVVELFDYLREPLVQSVSEDRSFRDPFNSLLEELADPKPGTKVLAEMLMKQCIIALLRSQTETGGECFVPWLAAIGDRALGRALAAMLDAPEGSHTLESLGELAGMSRGVFAERFKEAFGRTAIDCLKEVRLRRAGQLLTSTDLPVKTIAARVGFESRSYFSRAFKDFAGVDPASYRGDPVVRILNPR